MFLATLFHVQVPLHASVAVVESSPDQLIPVELRADLVVELQDAYGTLVLAIVVEVQRDLDQSFLNGPPQRLIGDKAYDSDGLHARLRERGVALFAPHRDYRKVQTRTDARCGRYRRRWKVERLFAWRQNFRRLVTRHEYHGENFWASCTSGASSSSCGIDEMISSHILHITVKSCSLTGVMAPLVPYARFTLAEIF